MLIKKAKFMHIWNGGSLNLVESFVGIAIAIAASTSLLISIALSDRTIKNSGIEQLNINEIRTLEKAGYNKVEIKSFEDFIKTLKLN